MSSFLDIFSAIPAQATAVGLASALIPIAGSMPAVVSNPDSSYSITFTPDQSDRVAQWIQGQIEKEPGSVRIEVGDIAWKVITREYWMYFAGAILLGFVFGRVSKSRKRGR